MLVHGPKAEVRCVRKIYNMFIRGKLKYTEIARQLTREGVPYTHGAKWDARVIRQILTHPKYIGSNVYGRVTQRMYTPVVRKPKSEWTVSQNSFEKMVDLKTYETAQGRIEETTRRFPRNRSDKALLNDLRKIWLRHGRITTALIENSKAPSVQTYMTRFGSLCNAYRLIKYEGAFGFKWVESRKRVQALRNELMTKIVELAPNRVSIHSPGHGFRTHLQMAEGHLISVIACRVEYLYKNAMYWVMKPPAGEYQMIAVVARLLPDRNTFTDIFISPPLATFKRFYLRKDDSFLQHCIPLHNLDDFFESRCRNAASTTTGRR